MNLSERDISSVDAFFAQPVHWDYLWARVPTDFKGREELKTAVGLALGYMLRWSDDDRRPEYGPFCPIWESDGRASAAPLATVEPDTVSAWAELGERCTVASAKARFSNLHWSIPAPRRPHKSALAAVDAYLELVGTHWPPRSEEELEDGTGRRSWTGIRRAECLRRAADIASETNNSERLKAVVERLESAIDTSCRNGAAPGVVLSLLAPAAQLAPARRPTTLASLTGRRHSGLRLLGIRL